MTKHTRESIAHLLMTNDLAVGRALSAIIEYQTAYEKQAEATLNDNGVGFMPCDAKKMTSMGMQWRRTKSLSVKQLAWLRSGKSKRYPSRICKYAGQLARIANGLQ